jgi:hypothetical protein
MRLVGRRFCDLIADNPQGGSSMGEVKRFVPKSQRIGREQLQQIEEIIDQLPDELVPAHAKRDMRRAVFPYARDPDESLWPGGFNMFSRIQMKAILTALRKLPPEARPNQVRHAFDLALLNLAQNTGEIMLTRDQLAEEIGCTPRDVSTIMGTLENLGIVRRERQKIPGMRGPGIAVYFINPHVAWNGDLNIRKHEATKHIPPLLKLMEGGASK